MNLDLLRNPNDEFLWWNLPDIIRWQLEVEPIASLSQFYMRSEELLNQWLTPPYAPA